MNMHFQDETHYQAGYRLFLQESKQSGELYLLHSHFDLDPENIPIYYFPILK